VSCCGSRLVARNVSTSPVLIESMGNVSGVRTGPGSSARDVSS
jgi:hypothetical protein